MKNNLFSKFENVFSDLRSLLFSNNDSHKKGSTAKIEEPKRPKKNPPQKTAAKKRSGRSQNTIESKTKSMNDSQGISNFSGSGYNGPGKPDHGKIRSNKKRR